MTHHTCRARGGPFPVLPDPDRIKWTEDAGHWLLDDTDDLAFWQLAKRVVVMRHDPRHELGDTMDLIHDQTGRSYGAARLVAVRPAADWPPTGDVDVIAAHDVLVYK